MLSEIGSFVNESKHEQFLWMSNQKLSASMGSFHPIPQSYRALRKECRKGIPEDLRHEVWMLLCSLHGDTTVSISNATASYDSALKKVLGESRGQDGHLYPPTFGGISTFEEHCLAPEGQVAVQRLSIVLQQLYALAYCPSLLDLLPTFLLYLTEADTFACVQTIFKIQRSKNADLTDQIMRKIQTNYSADIALVRMFKGVLEWRYKSLVRHMKELHAYDDRYFMLLYTKLFTGFLPLPVVLRIFDSFLLEGTKILCRVSMAMFKMCRGELEKSTVHGDRFWSEFRAMMNHPDFDYDRLLRISFRWRYGLYFKRSKMRKKFLTVRQDIDLQEKAATFSQHHPLQLANPENVRLLDPHRDYYFRSWLPVTIQTRKLRLLYSAEVHGRSLDTLYRECSLSKSLMLILIEVLETGWVIGAVTSDPIRKRSTFFGDSKTFVFRLSPNPQRYKNKFCIEDDLNIISPTSRSSRSSRTSILTPTPSPKHPRNSHHHNSLTEQLSMAYVNSQQYLLCIAEFLSIGVETESSAAALRLNAELTKGSSEATGVFDNPILVGTESEFEIGGIEVYDFIH